MAAVSKRLSKPFVRIAALFFLIFIGIQFIRPELENPPTTADLEMPPQVNQILRTSCYNCHSNETKIPWFDHIVPAYWIVAEDVKQGRRSLNFSELGKLPVAQQKAELFESINQIHLGAMPPGKYKLVHPDSTVTPEQLSILKNHMNPPGPNEASDSTRVTSANEQYDKWIRSSNSPVEVHPSPNGIEFPHEYREWKAISTADRFDNSSMRVVLGNDVAIKAVNTNQINPWPDGTIFAKVAWDQLTDEKGAFRTGEFIQVDYD
jgi:Haem-binding domain/Cytochrome P460